jgi:YVTN family beta-propeller protein
MKIMMLLLALGAAAATPQVTAKIKVAANTQPCAAAAGGRYVWVSEYASPWLVRIDPATNRVLGRTQIGFGSCGLGYGAGSLWVEDTSSNTVSRVSATTAKRIKAIPVGTQPYDATFAFGSAWVTANGSGEVDRIDPARNKVVKRLELPGAVGVVAAFGSIWASGSAGVVRIDPATNRVLTTVPLPHAAWTAASDDAVWVTNGNGVTPIDPETNTAGPSVVLGTTFLGDPALVAGLLWVPKVRANTVAVVDPSTRTVRQTIKVGLGPFVVTEVNGEAWIPSWNGRDVWRLRP